jgi:hypothetical protein
MFNRLTNNAEQLLTDVVSCSPGTIGAVDGCHVPIKAPQDAQASYINRQNFHSIVLQAVCDDKLNFIDCYAGEILLYSRPPKERYHITYKRDTELYKTQVYMSEAQNSCIQANNCRCRRCRIVKFVKVVMLNKLKFIYPP